MRFEHSQFGVFNAGTVPGTISLKFHNEETKGRIDNSSLILVLKIRKELIILNSIESRDKKWWILAKVSRAYRAPLPD